MFCSDLGPRKAPATVLCPLVGLLQGKRCKQLPVPCIASEKPSQRFGAVFVLLQKPEGEQLCSPWSQQQEQCNRVDHREWPPLPLSVGNQGNHAIMSQETGISCRHRHASCAANLCEISQSQPAGSAGFQRPSPGQALHTSRPCFYHRGWEVSNIELHCFQNPVFVIC